MAHLGTAISQQQGRASTSGSSSGGVRIKSRRTVVSRVYEAVKAIALCHNVTPMYDDEAPSEEFYEIEADQQQIHGSGKVTYQASSPDEVRLFDL